jgi:hypothetical protein
MGAWLLCGCRQHKWYQFWVCCKAFNGHDKCRFHGHLYYESDCFSPDPVSNLIQITADGAGNFSYQQLPPGDSGSGTYSVADDGTVTISDEADTHGQLSYDGGVFLFVDTSSDYPHIAVGIQQSSGMSDIDFSGIYQTVAVFYENNDFDTVVTGRGNILSDGSSNVDYTFFELSEGTASTGDGNISISSDGTCTSSGGMVGQLSSNGGLFAFPDADEVSDLYLFLVGIRKP